MSAFSGTASMGSQPRTISGGRSGHESPHAHSQHVPNNNAAAREESDYDSLEWKFVQSFGDDNSGEDDLVTAVEFDDTGDYLAVGDKAGRICIFEAHSLSRQRALQRRGSSINQAQQQQPGWPIEYKFYTEFQSHEPEFDCLKSLEIEEKINMIKFAKRTANGLFLLATNDKTIKFWKVHDKKIRRPAAAAQSGATSQRVNSATEPVAGAGANGLSIPQSTGHQTITMATLKRVYANAHTYHINSISINSDGTTFISADDLRVNLWSLDISDTSFNIIDLKPPNLEELTEVITSAIFHPISCNMLLYTSSRGTIRLCDLRTAAHAEGNTKQYECEEDPSTRSFFSEIISSISDAKFTADGRYIVSRDYMTLKIWDINMDNRPVAIIPTHDYLVPHLADLYENDCIFDKFECAASYDSQRFVTGSYNNHFVIYSGQSQSSVMIEALRDAPRPRNTPQQRQNQRGLGGLRQRQQAVRKDRMLMAQQPNVQSMDFAKKALHVAWHPRTNCIAIAGLNKLYLYQAFSPNWNPYEQLANNTNSPSYTNPQQQAFNSGSAGYQSDVVPPYVIPSSSASQQSSQQQQQYSYNPGSDMMGNSPPSTLPNVLSSPPSDRSVSPTAPSE